MNRNFPHSFGPGKKLPKHRLIKSKVKRWKGKYTIHEMADKLSMSYESLYYYITLYQLPYLAVNNNVDKKNDWRNILIG